MKIPGSFLIQVKMLAAIAAFGCIFAQTVHAQPLRIQWQQCLDLTGGTNGSSVFPVKDGFDLGCSGTLSGSGSDLLVIRTDSSGNTVWERSYGSPSGWDWFSTMKEVPGNGYVLFGTNQSDNYMYDLIIVRIDSLGTTQWSRIAGGHDFFEKASDIAMTADSGFLCSGAIHQGPLPEAPFYLYLVKLDKNGNVKWQKIVDAEISQAQNGSIIPMPDNGAILCGSKTSLSGAIDCPGQGGYDAYIIRIDSTGNILWQQCYGGSGDDEFNRILATDDGGYLAAGSTYSHNGNVSGNHGQSDFWVVKTDQDGTFQWQRCYGGSKTETLELLKEGMDGGYMIGGSSSSFDGQVTGNHSTTMNYKDFWLVHISSGGDLLWQQCIGGNSDEDLFDVAELPEGRFMLLGTTATNDSSGEVQCHMIAGARNWFVSTIDTTRMGTLETTGPGNGFKVFPNPATDCVTVERTGTILNSGVVFTLSDPAGREVLSIPMETTQRTMEISLGRCPRGVWYYQVTGAGNVVNGKLVLVTGLDRNK